MQANEQNKDRWTGTGANQELKGTDKAPGEEQGRGEKVTTNDLKGKKNDGDPSKEEDKPAEQ
jgi:hypothetical protein